MSKHTPGPWRFSTLTGGVFSQRKLVASVYGDDPDCKPDDRLKANARLIAAAPDLLEALELADCLLSGANMNRAVVERKVRAAIAKATVAA